VVIQDKVEIGAGCTIDRGVSGDTIVGRGTKIDNMVHIGHDTQIEANCLFAAGVAIAGGVQIKSGVTLWGQVGVTKTITIGENATQALQVVWLAIKYIWDSPRKILALRKERLFG
jgi:UDP-3-O-[3-hydroxymyristoyl] glucosamine N-acyltransferase